MNKQTLSTPLLLREIRVILTDLGMSELYYSFNFLTDIIFYMIKHNDDSVSMYKKSVNLISQKHSVTERSVINGVSLILKSCDDKLKTKSQFNLTHNSTLNKIRVIKNYVIEKLAI